MPRSETPLRSDLFPEISPYASGMLAVDGRHTIYWEQSGNPEGVPVVFLHGGPGAGSAPVHRRFFDPQFYRIVVFDQRGCGRSMPLGELHDNTTGHLVGRHGEAPRPSRHPRSWLLFGGSWGSTLALAYGMKPSRARHRLHPARHLPRRAPEIEWFLHGMRAIFPEAWRDFAEHLPAGRARRPAGQLLSPPDRSQSRHPPARGARLEPLRGGLLDALSDGARAVRIRPRRLRAGAVAHRGPLLLPTARSCPKAGRGTISTACATCPAPSSRAATTSSARR